ncbi:MAG TPA: type IV toxin-antitoxin system AbiEi family antitoxin domain-containing protein, partial [Pyrinomonadaceae bacterium]|nr:type IV toxin-antitoxin system AbiEi family antitoxin domain-containing protein [Pyrinomonadaceae bacterium]
DQVQSLLEKSTSIKVNRLFLYLAEKAGHRWFNQLKPELVNLGSGKRSIVKRGIYVDKYQITVPKELGDGTGI